MKQTLLIFLVGLITNTIGFTQKEFSYKTHGNMANFFASAEDMKSFFNFKNGDVIAEVGAGDGQNILGMALLVDSCSFYIEDIDPKVLNQSGWEKLYNKALKQNLSSKHQFNLVIGDEKSARLPYEKCDYIILSCSLHEFTYKDEMIKNLKESLKPNGVIYVFETECLAKGHTNLTAYETKLLMTEYGFTVYAEDHTQRNGSNGLYKMAFIQQAFHQRH